MTGNSAVTVPTVTGNTSVEFNDYEFAMGTGDESETLIITGSEKTASNTTFGSNLTATNTVFGTNLTATNTTLGNNVTVATGAVASNGAGTDIVTDVTISDKTVAKVGSAVTVATGATDADGHGDSIVTGVTIGSSAAAITALGTPSTANVIGEDSTFTNTQPSISLTANASEGTGRIKYIQEADPTASVPTITVGANDKVNAVTAMPTSSVGTAITVGSNDKVTTITGLGTSNVTNLTVEANSNDVVSAITSATLTGNE